MKMSLSITKLDVAEFARMAGSASGELCLQDMPRLADLCVKPLPEGVTLQTPLATWQAQGELRPQRAGEPQVWLHLHIKGQVPVVCQRCLKGVVEGVDLALSYRFVATEAQAVVEDGECEEDVLVLTRALDLPQLCEDELIMALPVVPMHEVCPDPLIEGLDHAGISLEVSDAEFDAALKEAEKEMPFASLESLRKKLH
jgi:Predicted metal-binding, possibly nucleic acid-binding protein